MFDVDTSYILCVIIKLKNCQGVLGKIIYWVPIEELQTFQTC